MPTTKARAEAYMKDVMLAASQLREQHGLSREDARVVVTVKIEDRLTRDSYDPED